MSSLAPDLLTDVGKAVAEALRRIDPETTLLLGLR